jgi:hypothetical protein
MNPPSYDASNDPELAAAIAASLQSPPPAYSTSIALQDDPALAVALHESMNEEIARQQRREQQQLLPPTAPMEDDEEEPRRTSLFTLPPDARPFNGDFRGDMGGTGASIPGSLFGPQRFHAMPAFPTARFDPPSAPVRGVGLEPDFDELMPPGPPTR